MKKVCLVKWIVDGVDGGLKVAINLANELSDTYDMHFVSMTSTVEHPFFEMLPNVNYHNFLKGKHKLSKDFLKVTKLLRAYLIKHDIDIVMSIGISANALILFAARGLKTKTIVCEHLNSKKGVFTKSNKIQRYLGAKLANHIVVLTEEDKINYINQYHVKKNKISYIYNWMTTIPNIKLADMSKKSIVTVGRFSGQKGYDLLVKVAERVLTQYPDWQWHIYGGGDSHVIEQYQKLIEQHQLAKQLVLHPVEKDLNKIYSQHSIYAMTSYFEGLPLVLLEAKQYQLPIVSFRCPTGPAEIIRHQVNGDLIPPYNIEEMSIKLMALMADEALRRQYSASAYLDMDKFDKYLIIDKWKKLIEAL